MRVVWFGPALACQYRSGYVRDGAVFRQAPVSVTKQSTRAKQQLAKTQRPENRSLHTLRPILRGLPLPIELIIPAQKELLHLRGPPVGISSRRQVSRLAE